MYMEISNIILLRWQYFLSKEHEPHSMSTQHCERKQKQKKLNSMSDENFQKQTYNLHILTELLWFW